MFAALAALSASFHLAFAIAVASNKLSLAWNVFAASAWTFLFVWVLVKKERA